MGQFGAWAPISAEQTASGYRVAWKVTGADQYQVWNTDSSGNYIANSIGLVSGADYALQTIESSFNQDLNGDGQIGLATTVIESNGSTDLSRIGNRFYLYDSGGAGPSLKYAGADIVAGQFGAWAPISAEQTASGYRVVWKVTGADQYQVWNTDSSGNYIANSIGLVSGADYALQTIESSFNQDLNGDGQIGLATTVIELNGSTDLSRIGNRFYLYDSGGAGPSLKYAGADIVAGQFGAWAPISAEQTASGYRVVWKVTGADQYQVWNTDSSGNYIANSIGLVSGAGYALQTIESSFNQDLNGDGQIGLAPAMVGGGISNGSGVYNVVGNDGDDILAASSWADTFHFKPNFGNDIIVAFDPGEDGLQFDRTIFVDVFSMIAHTADDGGGNTIITADDDNSVMLLDVTTATLLQHLGGFHFV